MQCVFEIHIDDRLSRAMITARRAAPLNYQYGRVEQWIEGPLDAASIENAKCVLRQRLEEATRNQTQAPVVPQVPEPYYRTLDFLQPGQYGPDAIPANEWRDVIERNQNRFYTNIGTGYGVYYDPGAAATIHNIRVAMQEEEDANEQDIGATDAERADRARAREAAG